MEMMAADVIFLHWLGSAAGSFGRKGLMLSGSGCQPVHRSRPLLSKQQPAQPCLSSTTRSGLSKDPAGKRKPVQPTPNRKAPLFSSVGC